VDHTAANYYNASIYTVSSAITVIAMRIKIARAATGRINLAIYTYLLGSSTFQRGTVERSNLAAGWQTFALTSPLTINAGTQYLLVNWKDGAYSFHSTSESQTNLWSALTYAASWPPALPAEQGKADAKNCMYAYNDTSITAPPTVTATVPATPTVTAAATWTQPSVNTPTPTGANVNGKVGVGVDMWCQMFADVMKTSRAWENIAGGAAGTDANGWPT
jgi:hypothetical protein